MVSSSTSTMTYTVPTSTNTKGNSNHNGGREFVKPLPKRNNNNEEKVKWFPALTTYFNYAMLILFGHIRDLLGKYVGKSRYFNASGMPPKVSYILPGKRSFDRCEAFANGCVGGFFFSLLSVRRRRKNIYPIIPR